MPTLPLAGSTHSCHGFPRLSPPFTQRHSAMPPSHRTPLPSHCTASKAPRRSRCALEPLALSRHTHGFPPLSLAGSTPLSPPPKHLSKQSSPSIHHAGCHFTLSTGPHTLESLCKKRKRPHVNTCSLSVLPETGTISRRFRSNRAPYRPCDASPRFHPGGCGARAHSGRTPS